MDIYVDRWIDVWVGLRTTFSYVFYARLIIDYLLRIKKLHIQNY